jgi:hypothetical protein
MPKIIDVLANDVFSQSCTSPVVTVVVPPVNGTASVNNKNEIEYTVGISGRDSLTYRVTCGGGENDEAKVYITVDASGSAFVDDVWYYGMNSQGIRFVDDGIEYVAHDASGESKVNSHENSLVVSSPYCDGQNIFYSSHNQLYNSFHEPMTKGHFMGHESVADGLAACYMGNNKYLFFSVTNAYLPDGATTRGLKAYIVDMNADHGRGEITDSIDNIEVAASGMSESIELLAANEAHKYWLIYAYKNGSHHELRVRPVDVSQTDKSHIVGNYLPSPVHTSTHSDNHTYTLKASPQHNRIAIAGSDDKTADVFDFDYTTGALSNMRTTPSSHPIDGIAYGIEFSPDGNQLYAAGYTTTGGGTPMLCQYTVTSNSLNYVDSYKYWTYSGNDGHARGGGLKLGPDGSIYVVLSYDKNVGVVSSPNLTSPLSERYSRKLLNYNPSSFALQFSTGLTKPSLMECNSNSAPDANADETSFCLTATSRTTKVNVLKNDTDPDADKIYLTGAEFINPSDEALADLTVNAADSTVTLTVEPDVYISPSGYLFDIVYHVKDNGLPASQCTMGKLKITAYPAPNYPDIRLRVCPNVGDVNLAKYIDATDDITDIQWTSRIPSIPISSPAGLVSTSKFPSTGGTFTFTYTVTSQCVTDQQRKVYLEILKEGRMRPLRDTIVICHQHAEAVNINQLFGIEANGEWEYPSAINSYITVSTSSSHAGAIVMNGKAIYQNVSSLTGNYHNLTNVKIVKFTYKTDEDSCLKGKSYDMVIVLTKNVMQ